MVSDFHMHSVAWKHPLTQVHNTTIIKILGIFKNKRVMKVLNVSEYSTVLFAYTRVMIKITIHTVKLKVHAILLYWSSEYFCRK